MRRQILMHMAGTGPRQRDNYVIGKSSKASHRCELTEDEAILF